MIATGCSPERCGYVGTRASRHAFVTNAAGSIRGAIESVKEAVYGMFVCLLFLHYKIHQQLTSWTTAMFAKVSPDLVNRLKAAVENHVPGKSLGKNVAGRWGDGLFFK